MFKSLLDAMHHTVDPFRDEAKEIPLLNFHSKFTEQSLFLVKAYWVLGAGSLKTKPFGDRTSKATSPYSKSVIVRQISSNLSPL